MSGVNRIRGMIGSPRPGRDRRAVLHRATDGAEIVAGRSAVVIGGGIAGLSAAASLAERGVRVTLLEGEETWGGRARSWDLPDGRSMSRGFHAFFRQYYTLRALLSRADPRLGMLESIGDYPLQLAGGPRDSFRGIPRTPPLSVAAFALRSPSMPLAQLARVDLRAAAGLLRVRFPDTFRELDGISAQRFLDELRFPADARHLALEVFARSFFADPREFSAGELAGMFHAYFMGSAEGLVFDVPRDAYSRCLWDPVVRVLRGLGVDARTGTPVEAVGLAGGAVRVRTAEAEIEADAVVVAVDPRSARSVIEGISSRAPGWERWRDRVRAERNAPPFAVHRLWLDRPVAASTPGFLGTSGFGPLDNVSVLDRFEGTAARWAREHAGSVVELHAYALTETGPAAERALRAELRRRLEHLHPELRGAGTVAEEWLVRDDCPLIGLRPWQERPTAATPDPRLVVAGDWLRTDAPVALMERAAVTGLQAADALLASWGARGHDWWSVPMRGVLAPVRRGARRARPGARGGRRPGPARRDGRQATG